MHKTFTAGLIVVLSAPLFLYPFPYTHVDGVPLERSAAESRAEMEDFLDYMSCPYDESRVVACTAGSMGSGFALAAGLAYILWDASQEDAGQHAHIELGGHCHTTLP
jgi:TPP-dependent pyruvate/acetoin dehydrogenase alpha subunit